MAQRQSMIQRAADEASEQRQLHFEGGAAGRRAGWQVDIVWWKLK